eukprot:4162214-Pleurochrysis_carterae.AAC.2
MGGEGGAPGVRSNRRRRAPSLGGSCCRSRSLRALVAARPQQRTQLRPSFVHMLRRKKPGFSCRARCLVAGVLGGAVDACVRTLLVYGSVHEAASLSEKRIERSPHLRICTQHVNSGKDRAINASGTDLDTTRGVVWSGKSKGTKMAPPALASQPRTSQDTQRSPATKLGCTTASARTTIAHACALPMPMPLGHFKNASATSTTQAAHTHTDA